MRLVILSGLSGSGKSVALHMLEDLGFYCIDNLPPALLKAFVSHTVRSIEPAYQRTAVGIDARSTDVEIATVPALADELRRSGIDCQILFLIANDEELLRRYGETRRAHPLSRRGESLREAIEAERGLLDPVVRAADMVIDTSRLSVHELRELIHQHVESRRRDRLSLLFQSFGFKRGIPGDAEFVFDARSLPNPYWDIALRPLTGRDDPVRRFLGDQPAVQHFIDDVAGFITARIPEHRAANRQYLSVAIGCTGGQHRSVYIVERLAERFAPQGLEVRVRHAALRGGAFVADLSQAPS